MTDRCKHVCSLDDGVDTQSGAKKEDLSDKEKKDDEEAPAPALRAKSILESWVWGRQPGVCPSQAAPALGKLVQHHFLSTVVGLLCLFM